MASPSPKVKELNRLLTETIDALDELNASSPDSGLETHCRQCDLNAKIWSLRTSIAFREGEVGVAEKTQKIHREWEAERGKAEKVRHLAQLPEIIEILARQDQEAEVLTELKDADVPDFDATDE